MVAAVLAEGKIADEFYSRDFPDNVDLIKADSIRSLAIIEADIYLDLAFEPEAYRMAALKKLNGPVVVNSVIPVSFSRINGWPTMLKRKTVEASFSGDHSEQARELLPQLGWELQEVPDITGMITPRIVSMIINEAWYTFGAGISSKEDIDTAMQLGTNYPYGPFEWGQLIGLSNIVNLLRELQKTDNRYTIAPALLNEINDNGTHFKY